MLWTKAFCLLSSNFSMGNHTVGKWQSAVRAGCSHSQLVIYWLWVPHLKCGTDRHSVSVLCIYHLALKWTQVSNTFWILAHCIQPTSNIPSTPCLSFSWSSSFSSSLFLTNITTQLDRPVYFRWLCQVFKPWFEPIKRRAILTYAYRLCQFLASGASKTQPMGSQMVQSWLNLKRLRFSTDWGRL